MIVSDSKMDELLKRGDLEGIRTASEQDPHLIRRGWRDGAMSWVMSACLYDTYKSTVPLLIELGADINAGKKEFPTENAMNSALSNSDIEKTTFLLSLGADPLLKRDLVWGAVVAERNQLELVKVLDQHGADIHYVDEGGFSGRYANPLSLAKDYGLDHVVEYLQSRGCVMPPSDEESGEQPASEMSLSEQIIEHFTQSVGSPEKLSLIQIVPTGIPISIHAIPASENKPYVTLFTTGMAEYPMAVPEGAEEYAYAELYIQLPANWNYRAYEDPNWGWPQHWLRSLAQYPHQHNSWLGGPVALVANEDPPQPLAPNTRFTTLLLFADQSLITQEGKKIWLYRMTPLYTEERQLEIDHGLAALLNALDAHDAPMIVDMNRKSVASK